MSDRPNPSKRSATSLFVIIVLAIILAPFIVGILGPMIIVAVLVVAGVLSAIVIAIISIATFVFYSVIGHPVASTMVVVGAILLTVALSYFDSWYGPGDNPKDPRIRLPRIRLPRIRLPRIKLPRIKLPHMEAWQVAIALGAVFVVGILVASIMGGLG